MITRVPDYPGPPPKTCPKCGGSRIKVTRQPLWATDELHRGMPDFNYIVELDCLDCKAERERIS